MDLRGVVWLIAFVSTALELARCNTVISSSQLDACVQDGSVSYCYSVGLLAGVKHCSMRGLLIVPIMPCSQTMRPSSAQRSSSSPWPCRITGPWQLRPCNSASHASTGKLGKCAVGEDWWIQSWQNDLLYVLVVAAEAAHAHATMQQTRAASAATWQRPSTSRSRRAPSMRPTLSHTSRHTIGSPQRCWPSLAAMCCNMLERTQHLQEAVLLHPCAGDHPCGCQLPCEDLQRWGTPGQPHMRLGHKCHWR